MDWLTVVLAISSGVAMGTFPVFIKTDAVLRAAVHPVVFQLYKASWVAIFGVGFAIVRLLRGLNLEFTWWAAASAAAWIPSGLSTIVSVPRIGVGSSVLTTAATGSSLQFVVGWLCFGEKFRLHKIGGREYVLAPYYFCGCVIGMGGLVCAQHASLRRSPPAHTLEPLTTTLNPEEVGGPRPADDPGAPFVKPRSRSMRGRTVLGYVTAASAGAFSALQSGIVEYGQRQTDGPHPAPHEPPDERFDALGSWLALFTWQFSGGSTHPCAAPLTMRTRRSPARARFAGWPSPGVAPLPGAI